MIGDYVPKRNSNILLDEGSCAEKADDEGIRARRRCKGLKLTHSAFG